jgi:hypothetical protein
VHRQPSCSVRRPAARGLLPVLLGMLVVLGACYPGGPEDLDDLDLVLTFRDQSVDFSGLARYAMLDTVFELDVDDSSAEPLDPRFDPTILESLQRNMESRGFVRETDPANNPPDVWLEVGAIKSDVWVYYYRWGYYPPGWGCCYYPPSLGTAKFDQGSIVWQLLDLRNYDPNDPDAVAPVMWYGGINGALSSSNSTNHEKIAAGIDQGFAQSTYVQASPFFPKRGAGARGQEVQP